jgi:hypothetical protein
LTLWFKTNTIPAANQSSPNRKMTPEQNSNEASTVSYGDVLNEYYEELEQYMRDLATELGVSVNCAHDVWYLRTRSRHTPELEAELIARWAAGIPPNIGSFGVTEDTQSYIRSIASGFERNADSGHKD